MFNVNDIVVVKEAFGSLYAVTTTEAICIVTAVPNDDSDNYEVKVIKHSVDDFVGTEHIFDKDEFEESFEHVSDEISNEIKDQALILTGWRRNDDVVFSDIVSQSILDIVQHFRAAMSIDFDDYDLTIYRDTRILVNDIMPRRYPEIYNGEIAYVRALDWSYDTAEGLINKLSRFNPSGDYKAIEVFCNIPVSEMDNFLGLAAEKLSEKYDISECPYTVDGFSNPHKIYILELKDKENVFAYVTNHVTASNIPLTALWLLQKLGVYHTEAVKEALLAEDKLAYINAVNDIIIGFDKCRTALKRERMFSVFKDSYTNMLVEPIKRKIDHIQNDIDSYETHLRDLFNSLRSNREKLFYYETHSSGEDDEFIKYTKQFGDNIINIKIANGSSILFDIKTYMSFWDEDIYSTVRKSDTRFKELSDALKSMLDEIFLTRDIKLIIEQKFTLDITNSYVSYNNEAYRSNEGEGNIGMRNPHIQRYSCFGDYKSHITKALSEMDVMQAYNLAYAACSGLTWTDGPVTDEFFKYIKSDRMGMRDIKCLEMKDGTLMTIKEYVNKFNKDGRRYEP